MKKALSIMGLILLMVLVHRFVTSFIYELRANEFEKDLKERIHEAYEEKKEKYEILYQNEDEIVYVDKEYLEELKNGEF